MKILLVVFIRWNKIRSYTEKLKYPHAFDDNEYMTTLLRRWFFQLGDYRLSNYNLSDRNKPFVPRVGQYHFVFTYRWLILCLWNSGWQKRKWYYPRTLADYILIDGIFIVLIFQW